MSVSVIESGEVRSPTPLVDGISGDRFSLTEALDVVVRRRWWVIGATIFFLLAIPLRNAFRPKTYTSAASFIPNVPERTPASLAGFAAQFGIDVGPQEVGQTPEFYAEFLESRQVMRRAVEATYPVRANSTTRQQTLVDFLRAKGSATEARVNDAIEQLRRKVSVDISRQTGLVRLHVEMTQPELAHAIGERLLQIVNDFNVRNRRSQAGAERQFVEARLREMAADLRKSENALQLFLQSNRSFEDSPQLTFEHDRLERDVIMRQELYTAVSQAYEKARVEEVRNTPVITVIDDPNTPTRHNSRRLARGVILAIMLGLVMGTVLAFAHEWLAGIPNWNVRRRPALAKTGTRVVDAGPEL